MANAVLDSSAILAVLNREKGDEKAIEHFPHGIVSTVSLTEVLAKLIEQGHNSSSATKAFQMLQLPVVDFDTAQAQKAAELRPLTKHLGLSLGDLSCLALAILHDATAVTADRGWQTVTLCPIEIIR